MSSYRMKYKIGLVEHSIVVPEDISVIPLGTILPYSANTLNPPVGFLFCDGSAISRSMYPDLFALIGTLYGEGDGSTTFNLPNLTGRYLQGDVTAGTVKAAGLPNITGEFGAGIRSQTDSYNSAKAVRASGAFGINSASTTPRGYYSAAGTVSSSDAGIFNIDASRSSAIYGNSTTVTPPTLTVRYIIKAFDSQTRDSALIDITQYSQELAHKLSSSYASRTRKPFTLENLILAVAANDYAKYDINPGDYYEGASGYTYVFSGGNPMRGIYPDYTITADHAGLIVDTHKTCKWNDTNDTTGGYVSSVLHSYLVNTALPKVKTDLGGVSHLYSHKKLYSNSINKTSYNRLGSASGVSNNWAWSADQYIAALSEVQVYGSIVWSSSGHDTGEADQQLEVFRRFKPMEIFGNEYVWLRDVVSSSYVAITDARGSAYIIGASGVEHVAGLIAFH